VFMNYVSVIVICMIGLPADFSYMFSYLVGFLCTFGLFSIQPAFLLSLPIVPLPTLQLYLKITALYSGQVQFTPSLPKQMTLFDCVHYSHNMF